MKLLYFIWWVIVLNVEYPELEKKVPQMEIKSCAVKYNTELLFILTLICELCKLPTARTV